MMNLGAIKLRLWRRRGQPIENACPDAGRDARSVTLEEVGERVGVGKQMMGLIERGQRSPSLAVAAKLEEIGVCPASDWTKQPRCGECRRVLSHPPLVPPCGREGCEFAEADCAIEDAA